MQPKLWKKAAVLGAMLGAQFLAADAALAGPPAQKFVTLNGEQFPALEALPPPPIPADLPVRLGPDGHAKLDEKGAPIISEEYDPLVYLGYLLFFDTRISGDGSTACSTCHLPKEGWGLNSQISRGYPGTSHWRNSHTIVNTAYLGKLFWQANLLALEPQAKSANAGFSGNGKDDMMEERVVQSPVYRRLFKKAFGTDLPTIENVWRAMAAFERVMNDYNTPFDRYMRGDKTALTPQQIKGMELFQGKAGCIQCHNGPMLTDEKFYNTSVPPQRLFDKDPVVQSAYRWQNYSKGLSEEVYRKARFDLGLYFNTKVKEHMGKLRTQPLRYLVYQPPYMHNGSIDSLEEVVEFYNKGGGEDPVLKTFGFSTKSKRLKPLNLTKEEQAALVAFLESTSGPEIILPEVKGPPDEPMPNAVEKFVNGKKFPSEAERFLRVAK